MKITHNILITISLLSTLFLQAQQTKRELFLQQINELTEQKDFIARSNCPQQEDIITEYNENFDILINDLNLAFACYNTPQVIEESRIKEQTDTYTIYQSNNLSNVLVKRYGSKISMSGLVSDNSPLKVGTRYITETFSFEGKEIKARYFQTKNSNYLLSFEVIYENKKNVFIDLSTYIQADFSVHTTNEYGSDLEKIQIYFSNSEIGKINWINVNKGSYELFRGKYNEKLKDNPHISIIKHKYGTRCNDANGNTITATRENKEEIITPTTELLWYTGYIDKKPITLELKRSYNKDQRTMDIETIRYAYDKEKKWIDLHDFKEPQAAILANEKHDEIPLAITASWNVTFESNKILKGEYDTKNGNILPITLNPYSTMPSDFTYKVEIKEELTTLGDVTDQFVTALNIYKDTKKIQSIPVDDYNNLAYFNFTYVDANYDGYLDLAINNSLYFYQPKTQIFEQIKDLEDEYFEISEFYYYNFYTKSITAERNRNITEYRAVNGKLIPYESNSHFFNDEDEIVYITQKYINGKWEVVEESVEKIEDEDDHKPAVSSDMFDLVFSDIDFKNENIYFSPIFKNNQRQDYFNGTKAKLYTVLKDANGKIQSHFLFNTSLNGDESQLLDDVELIFTGENYFLVYANKLIPFFPNNLTEKEYDLSLAIEHPVFGSVSSQTQKITLPLPMKIDTSIAHFTGTIGKNVQGDIYFKTEDRGLIGTFINTKTGKHIDLRGTHPVLTASLVTYFHLEEFEKNDELSGYFEGSIEIETPKKFTGNWISPDRKTKVPFEFKKVN